MDCLFCNIMEGTVPSSKVYEDEFCFAFYDIHPQAPVHVLVIPKTHICCADAVTAENSVFVAKIFEAIPQIAKKAGIVNGYRIVSNCGEDACQTVKHLHFHILGGKPLPEQMG